MTPPHAILASNTSSLAITDMAAATKRPDKVLGLHFMQPVPVMPLLEMVRTFLTSEETFQTAKAFGESLGKTIVVSKDNARLHRQPAADPLPAAGDRRAREGRGDQGGLRHGDPPRPEPPDGAVHPARLRRAWTPRCSSRTRCSRRPRTRASPRRRCCAAWSARAGWAARAAAGSTITARSSRREITGPWSRRWTGEDSDDSRRRCLDGRDTRARGRCSARRRFGM